MSHPFEIKLEDLSELKTDFLEELTAEEAQTVHGGFVATTYYATIAGGEAGEEGGGGIKPVTTLRPDTVERGEVGEEGGGGGHWWT
jgi:hypothetical protein